MPFVIESEKPTFIELIINESTWQPSSDEDLGDKNVCDLACGEGIYTREFRRLTKGRVVGIDISENQLKLAEAEENPDAELKIEYKCADCSNPEFIEDFDRSFHLVSSTYLLNYATSKEMLNKFVKSAYDILKPGGRFIGINTNPFVVE